jgi:hypothetical protein
MDTFDNKDLVKSGVSSEQIEHAAMHEDVSFSPEEEKALVRKIDLTLLPTIWFMYLLSYMDRTKYVAPKWSGDIGLIFMTPVLEMRKYRGWTLI